MSLRKLWAVSGTGGWMVMESGLDGGGEKEEREQAREMR